MSLISTNTLTKTATTLMVATIKRITIFFLINNLLRSSKICLLPNLLLGEGGPNSPLKRSLCGCPASTKAKVNTGINQTHCFTFTCSGHPVTANKKLWTVMKAGKRYKRLSGDPLAPWRVGMIKDTIRQTNRQNKGKMINCPNSSNSEYS